MNTSKAKKNTKETKEREYCEVRAFEVRNARVVTYNSKDVVFFTLMLNGIFINNCKVVEGKNGDFISFPQYKGGDGKYYNNVYVSLSDEDSAKILEEIQKQIDAM